MNELERAMRTQQQRRSRQEGIESVRPSHVLLTGEFRFIGAGEGIVEVTFPEPFAEKPITTFGFEFHSDVVNEIPDTVVYGNFPQVTLGVAAYKVNTNLTPGINPTRVFYTGMHVMIKTTGNRNQKLIIGWHAHGNAYNGVN